MDPIKAEFLTIIFVSIGFFTSVTSIAYYWFNRRGGKMELPRELAGMDERLRRIEQAVDSIAIEVERVSEGQRFVTRLLADPGQAPSGVGAESPEGARARLGRSI
ncbi:MAG: hypothetical protein ABR543_03515 [Gemmatimonadaceae bacterium]